jgi:hypothetical protein
MLWWAEHLVKFLVTVSFISLFYDDDIVSVFGYTAPHCRINGEKLTGKNMKEQFRAQ